MRRLKGTMGRQAVRGTDFEMHTEAVWTYIYGPDLTQLLTKDDLGMTKPVEKNSADGPMNLSTASIPPRFRSDAMP